MGVVLVGGVVELPGVDICWCSLGGVEFGGCSLGWWCSRVTWCRYMLV